MSKRLLGNSIPVSSLGLGCMGIAEFYEKIDKSQALATIKQALDLGITYFDTADMYGLGKSESFLAEALGQEINQVIISSKFGFVRQTDNVMQMQLNGKPEYVMQACEKSLTRLKRDYLDVYYLHRVDPNTPIEETIGAMKRLVEQGKIKQIGLSDTTEENILRACKVHPISSYQTEYSLWHRDHENTLLKLCESLGITFIPYSPLGRGFLTGKLKTEFSEGDFRKILPRFSPENYLQNLKKLALLSEIAKEKNCSLAQLSLAWALSKSPHIVPIPGATHPMEVLENVAAMHINLQPEDILKIENIMPIGSAIGTAYPQEMNTH